MILSVLRVIAGFALACCVAGVVQLSFAAPSDVFTGDVGRLTWSGEQVLLAATHSAVFSAPFALVAAAIGEWQSLRGIVYYILAGTAIAVAGFIALYSGETGGPQSIVNQYAVITYLSAGFAGGLVYWLCSGRYAGDAEEYAKQRLSQSAATRDDDTAIDADTAKAGPA